MLVTTRLGEMDEAQLQKRLDVFENEDQRVEATEYCLQACDGSAHITGIPTGDGSFCERHVKRSCHVVVKKWPEEIRAEAASLA